MTLSQIAEWEARSAPMREFWVIAPNFFGDKYPEVRQAMLDNFNRSSPVYYRYFLRSLTDVRRLLRFVESLKADAPNAPDKVTAYVLGPNPLLDQECFIAVHDKSHQLGTGYFLSRGNREFARRMESAEVTERLDRLRHLASPKAVPGWAFNAAAITSASLGNRFVLAIHTRDLHRRLNDDPNMIEFYHDWLAAAVSQRGGEVVDATGNTSVATFNTPANQSEWQAGPRVLKALLQMSEIGHRLWDEWKHKALIETAPRFGLAWGPVTRVLRASGFVVYGEGITFSKHLAKIGLPGSIDAAASFVKYLPDEQKKLFRAVGNDGCSRCDVEALRVALSLEGGTIRAERAVAKVSGP